MASKFLPCLLLKPLSSFVCPSVSRSLISSSERVRFAFQTEHGQPTLRVIAAYHLAVELHRACSALGTLAAGIPAGEQFVAREQFGGNLPCVPLNLLAESVVRQFPTLNTCPAPSPTHLSWRHRRCASFSRPNRGQAPFR